MAKVFRNTLLNGEISMKKKALLAVLLVMTLLLSSCALVVKDKEVDAKTVILKMGDKEITKAEVQKAVQNELDNLYETYAMYYGTQLDISDPQVVASAQSTAVDSLKKDMVLRAKAAELGLDQLTEEETAQAKENAQDSWESAKTYIQNNYLTDEQKELEGDELESAIQEKLDALGTGMEDFEKAAADQIVDDKVRDYAIKDVAVSDEEIKAGYDEKVAADEEKYKENASSWASADRSGTDRYYTPAGIRRVKQILIKFKEDDQTAINDANGKITEVNSRITAANNKIKAAQDVIDSEDYAEEEKAKASEDLAAANTELETANADLEAAQAELKAATDTAFANLDEDTDAVLDALKENPDSWDSLMAEKNEDPGMKEGAVNAETGYAVCEGMTGFDSAFVDAAMALASVGDISGKVRGETYGYYIIKYVGDETEGAVDFDSVKEKLHDEILSEKQDKTYTETLDKWVEEAGIKEDLNALKD